jgi:pyrimidine operon attenuation protein / uracil phosphoribosyltransferase
LSQNQTVMKILDDRQIRHKLKRLTIQILENNINESEIILAGINNNGVAMAQLLMHELLARTQIPITLTRIRLNPASPINNPIILEMPLENVANKAIIVVDDVANTGRTIYYALKPLMDSLPRKVEVAVLVDRKHKSYPIQADYVGLSLATTLKENIEVQIRDVEQFAVHLN